MAQRKKSKYRSKRIGTIVKCKGKDTNGNNCDHTFVARAKDHFYHDDNCRSRTNRYLRKKQKQKEQKIELKNKKQEKLAATDNYQIMQMLSKIRMTLKAYDTIKHLKPIKDKWNNLEEAYRPNYHNRKALHDQEIQENKFNIKHKDRTMLNHITTIKVESKAVGLLIDKVLKESTQSKKDRLKIEINRQLDYIKTDVKKLKLKDVESSINSIGNSMLDTSFLNDFFKDINIKKIDFTS